MANEAALKFIDDQIAALELVKQELSRIFFSTTDLDFADKVRARITSLNPVLFTMKSTRNTLEATAHEVPPPSAARIQELAAALQRLDGFVTNDQKLQAALTFLTDIATTIRNV
jgi:hypothetical protein